MPKYYDTLPDSLAGRGDFPEPGTYPGRLFERTDAARNCDIRYRVGLAPDQPPARRSESRPVASGFLVVPEVATDADNGSLSWADAVTPGRLGEHWSWAGTLEEAHFLAGVRAYSNSPTWGSAMHHRRPGVYSTIYPATWTQEFNPRHGGDDMILEVFPDDERSVEGFRKEGGSAYPGELVRAARDGSLRKFLEQRAN